MSKRKNFGSAFRDDLTEDAVSDPFEVDSAEGSGEGTLGDENIFGQIASPAQSKLVIHKDGTMKCGAAELTKTGITNVGDLGEQDLRYFGDVVFQLDNAVQWWIGDWLNRVEIVWGESYEQIAENTGREISTLYDYKSVAKKVPFSVRTEELSYNHHRVIAYDADPQNEAEWLYWINLALEGEDGRRWSVARLKREIRQQLTENQQTGADWFRPVEVLMGKYTKQRWRKLDKNSRKAIYNGLRKVLQNMEEWGV